VDKRRRQLFPLAPPNRQKRKPKSTQHKHKCKRELDRMWLDRQPKHLPNRVNPMMNLWQRKRVVRQNRGLATAKRKTPVLEPQRRSAIKRKIKIKARRVTERSQAVAAAVAIIGARGNGPRRPQPTANRVRRRLQSRKQRKRRGRLAPTAAARKGVANAQAATPVGPMRSTSSCSLFWLLLRLPSLPHSFSFTDNFLVCPRLSF